MEIIIDQRALRLILTLSDELHFGRAAGRLHISQPTLSGAIKNIERRLGVQLFRRSTRHVELTEAGELMKVEARHLMNQTEAAVARVRESASRFTGPFRIAYSSSVNMAWLSQLMSSVQNSGVLSAEAEFVSAQPAEIESSLAKGTVHAGLLLGPVTGNDLQTIHLSQEEFCLAVSSGHVLAEAPRITSRMLSSEPVVWLQRDLNVALYEKLARSCASMGFHPHFTYEAATFYECLHIARAGVAITVVPSHMRHDAFEGVVFRDFPQRLFAARNLVARRDSRIDPLKAFARFVRDFARTRPHLPDP
jgi:DNA-binding transcriptional LysR family regulator